MVKRVTILGAGISGLTLAWYLQKLHGDQISLTLLEKSNRVGGWIQTFQKSDFLFELGPRSCRPHGTGVQTLELIAGLGLQDQILYPDPSAHVRYLYSQGKLQEIPSNPFKWLFSPLRKGVLQALWNDWRNKQSSNRDESIYDFAARRFGPEIANQFFDPMVSGIYAGDIHQLSMQSCFPKIIQWEHEHGGVLRGMFKQKRGVKTAGPLFTLKQGMETLPRELARQFKGELRLNCDVKSIENGKLTLKDGEIIETDYLYCATPSSYFNVPKIPTASIAVVSMGYRKSVLAKKGFGYLIPSQEKQEILGVVWDSSIFPSQNTTQDETRLTVMIGGSKMTNFNDFAPSDFYETATRSLQKHLGIKEKPDAFHVHLAKDAIPQYLVGHNKMVHEIKKEISQKYPDVLLLGSSYSGVSVNDCIAEAKKCAVEFPLSFAKKV